MAVLSNTGILAGASGAAGAEAYTVKRSARFNDDDTAYLSNTFPTAGNRTTWTWSGWIKRRNLGTTQRFFSGVTASSDNNATALFFFTDDTLRIGGYSTIWRTSNDVFRDSAAWYHLTVAVNLGNGAATKYRAWMNNVEVTWTGTGSNETTTGVNAAAPHCLGAELYGTTANSHSDILLADVHFVDGSALTPGDFAEADSTTGQWVPKEYSGSYGTNGFHLAMDPANGGADYSSGGVVTGGTLANPENAFNGSTTGAAVLTASSTSTACHVDFTLPTALTGVTKIEHYFESPSGSGGSFGRYNGSNAGSTRTGTSGGYSDTYSGSAITVTSLGWSINQGGTGTNNDNVNAIRITDSSGTYIILDHSTIGYDSSGNSNNWKDNNLFANEHTVATENFKAVGYKGTGSSHAVNVGFKPDLVWIKERGGSANHHWLNSISGAGKKLQSNTTDPEEDVTTEFTSFDTNGFTLGASNDTNQDGENFVAWCWKAASASTTNDASSTGIGTIDSTYKANTDAGFSVVSYTGTATNGTVAHGLGKAPKFVIVKGRDEDGMAWSVYHDAIGHNGGNNYIELQSDAAAGADNTAFQDTAPTSTVFTIGTKPPVNESGDKKIAFCWAETAGVSKFGSFAGSGSTVAIDCGFPPAMIIIKSNDTAGQEWVIKTKTLGTGELFAHSASQETFSRTVNFLPNGFSVNGGQGPVNYAGRNYIFMAWAGSPEGDLDLLTDTPGAPYDNELNGGGNYCTWNTLRKGNGVLSDGNLKFQGDNSWEQTHGTFGVSTGKWYYEMTLLDNPYDQVDTSHYWIAGFTSNPNYTIDAQSTDWLGFEDTGWYRNFGSRVNSSTVMTAEGVVSFSVDLDANTFNIRYNNSSVLSGTIGGTPGRLLWPFHMSYHVSGFRAIANFGQRAFKYTPPTGYKALNTYNLSPPTITKGNTGFDTKLFTGTGSSQSTTGLEFEPDLVWIKGRSVNHNHHLFDQIRGVTKVIYPNSNAAEGTEAQTLTAFTSDGFTVGTDNSVNQSSTTYASWAWDAGSANVSKSPGDSNSSAYNQSEEWSAGSTSGSAYSGSYTFETTFNGSTTGNGASAATNSGNDYQITLPSGVTIGSGITVYVSAGQEAANLWLNDREVNMDALITTFTSSDLSGDTTLTKIGVDAGIQIVAIKADGKLLVDDDVTPTNVPSLATTYRVNTNTGFSVVKYNSGGSSGNYTVAHGLNAAPNFIIHKRTDGTGNWWVYHSSVITDMKDYLQLNSNAAKATNSAEMWGASAPTSVVFGTRVGDLIGTSQDAIAYCWSEVSGYSKFGSYTGNASADGPFVWCGFKPRWLLVKRSDSGTNDWYILDTARDTDNVAVNELLPNSDSTENPYTGVDFDFLSNGFKARATEGSINASGGTFIFAAFAESPFKYSNAR